MALFHGELFLCYQYLLSIGDRSFHGSMEYGVSGPRSDQVRSDQAMQVTNMVVNWVWSARIGCLWLFGWLFI